MILLPLLLVLFIQMLTGRRIVYMNRFRPGAGMHPRPPEADPEPEREVRASEAVIDAEVVDLPDEPPPQIGAEKR